MDHYTNLELGKRSEGIKSTQKICLVSTSEIKAGKEQFDHEVKKPNHHLPELVSGLHFTMKCAFWNNDSFIFPLLL